MNRGIHIFLTAVLLWLSLHLTGCSRFYEHRINKAEKEITSLITLSGYEYRFKEILFFGKEKSILGFKLVDKGFLASLDIVLTAGFDLSKGFEIQVSNAGHVTVFLPDAEILHIDADETSIREYYSYQRGEAITHMDLYRQIEEVKPSLVKEAINQGILEKTEENVRILLGEFIQTLGFEDITFKKISGSMELMG